MVVDAAVPTNRVRGIISAWVTIATRSIVSSSFMAPQTNIFWRLSDASQAGRQGYLSARDPRLRVRLRRPIACIFLATFCFAGCGSRKDPKLNELESHASETQVENKQRRQDYLSQARRSLQNGDLESASLSADKALLQNPDSDDAKLLAGQIASAKGNHRRALDLVESIDPGSRLGPKASLFRCEQLMKLNRISEAADAIEEIIRRAPAGERQTIELHRQAWGLLCQVGRRQEASEHADALCLAGGANQPELLSLARRNDSYPIALETGGRPDKYFQPGLGMARWYFTQREFQKAIDALGDQPVKGFESPAAHALYGRLLADTQQMELVPRWYAGCDSEVSKFSDYWIALGTYFFDQQQFEASARTLLIATQIDPTDYSGVNRLARVFEALGKIETSEQFRHRDTLNYQFGFIAENSPPNGSVEQSEGIPRLLVELGRPFEALGWTRLAIPPSDGQSRNAVAQKVAQLRQDPNARVMAREMALVGVNPDQYDMESALEKLKHVSPVEDGHEQSDALPGDPLAIPKLVNVASELGLEFRWFQDVENGLSLIPLHELMGGGAAILDYDLDGWPDIYLAQGGGEPPTDSCRLSNPLFRNLGFRFQEVTERADAGDRNYSSGIAAGDVNQDGLIDLFLGSLGRNRLLINNGDGSFSDATSSWGKVEDRFSSSLAIADVNRDALPDLFEAVYVEMADGFKAPELADDGGPMQPSPVMHYAQSDRLFENLGDGSFRMHEISREVADPGTSLGVVVTDFDGDGGNEVFVGNDARTNHFLEIGANNQFVNTAGPNGIASGFTGDANACMGIATGDFDRDGSFDMHIANYSKESANHYLQSPSGGFTDLAARYGIDTITMPYIGFGTKAVDVDRNGWLDLLVTNGHVFDLRNDGDEFQMPPQYLANRGDRFELTGVEDTSGYWDGKYLGRTMAMADFDRDGRIDFVVGHLHQPLALLHNQTATEGSWIQVELVGTDCERDAVGAKITVTTMSGQSFSQWVTAGDGYLCSDEPVIDLGLGKNDAIKEVRVLWPGGATQVLDGLKVGHRYLIVQNETEAYLRQ